MANSDGDSSTEELSTLISEVAISLIRYSKMLLKRFEQTTGSCTRFIEPF